MAAVALATWCLGTTSPAKAATALRHTLAQLVHASDATVLGHTLERGSFWDHGRIVTRVSLQVDEVWHGGVRPGDTLDIYTLGGSVGEIGQRVDGAAALPSYGRVVVHLRRAQRGYVPTAMAQGVWNVDDLYGSRTPVHPQAPASLALLAGPSGTGSPAALPQTLAALRAAVQEAHLARP